MLTPNTGIGDPDKNWSCPSATCKENFRDEHGLLLHVVDCMNFSAQDIYCNTCKGNECFPPLRHEPTSYSDSNNSQSSDKESTRDKTRRRIGNIFKMSVPTLRPSSRGKGRDNSFKSGSSQDVVALMALSPSEPMFRDPATTYSSCFVPNLVEMDPIGVCELHGTGFVPELPATESHGFARTNIKGPTVQAPAPKDLILPSPVSLSSTDLSQPSDTYGSMTNQAFSKSHIAPRQSDHPAINTPNEPSFPALTSPVAQANTENHDTLSTKPILEPTRSHQHKVTAFSSAIDQGNPCQSQFHSDRAIPSDSLNSDEMNSPMFHGFEPKESYFDKQNLASDYNSQLTIVQPSFSAINGQVALMAEPHAPLLLRSQPPGSSAISALSSTSPPTVAPQQFSLPDQMVAAGKRCPYHGCNYRPTGIKANWDIYMRKHMEKHDSEGVLCEYCKKHYSRKDNLKIHQENSCPKSPWRIAKRPAGRDSGAALQDDGRVHLRKRPKGTSGEPSPFGSATGLGAGSTFSFSHPSSL